MSALFRSLSLTERLFFTFSFLLHVLAFFYATGYQHGDEHFQILEFTAYKLGLCDFNSLAWEYPEQMRSGLMPFVAFIVSKCVCFFNSSWKPFVVSDILRAISLILGFISLFALKKTGEALGIKGKRRFLFCFLLCFLWFLPFLHARYSSENYSGIFMIYALYFFFCREQKNTRLGFVQLIISGVFWGLAFECRFQSGFAAVAFFAWALTIGKMHFKALIPIFIGGIFVLSVGLLIDHWLYGNWAFPAYNYLYQVLFATDSMFGKNPWYDYLPLSISWFGYSVGAIVALLSIDGCLRNIKSPLVWIFVFFIFIHCLLAHKEIRFLFPVFYLLPFILASCFPDTFYSQNTTFWISAFKKSLMVFVIFLCGTKSIVTSACYASPDVNTFRKIGSLTSEKEPIIVYCPYDIGYVMAHYYEFRFFKTAHITIKYYHTEEELNTLPFKKKGSYILQWNDYTLINKNPELKVVFDSFSAVQENPIFRGTSWNRDRYRIYCLR
jgi:phosphatidylinositol glycan class B